MPETLNKLKRPSIALIDDHLVMRKGAVGLLTAFNEFNIAFDVDGFEGLVEQLQKNRHIDVLLMDIKMPGKDGFEIAAWMRSNYPLIKVLAFSSESDGYSIAKVMRNGAKGFVSKSASPTELLLAIQTVLKGDAYLSQNDFNTFQEVIQNSAGYFNQEIPDFNDKEKEFIKWACTSLSYKEIADRMYIAVKTVDSYRNFVFSKLGIHTRQELAVYASQNNLI